MASITNLTVDSDAVLGSSNFVGDTRLSSLMAVMLATNGRAIHFLIIITWQVVTAPEEMCASKRPLMAQTCSELIRSYRKILPLAKFRTIAAALAESRDGEILEDLRSIRRNTSSLYTIPDLIN